MDIGNSERPAVLLSSKSVYINKMITAVHYCKVVSHRISIKEVTNWVDIIKCTSSRLYVFE